MNVRLSHLFLLFLTFLILPPSPAATHAYDELNRLTETIYDTGGKVTTIGYTYDPAGNMLTFDISANFLPGDVNNNDEVNLTDAVLCLQIISGVPLAFPVNRGADIDGDRKISTVELIYILQKVAGLRLS